MKPLLASGVAVLIAIACVHTNAAVMDESLKLTPLCPQGVKLFTDTAVGAHYVQVAVLHSTATRTYTNEESMIKDQRKKAAELGANGLILGANKDPSTGAVIASSLGFGSANRKGDAVAIYIPSDSARVNAVCGGKE